MTINRLSTALSDRYRIERELGAGGMATVYLARDLKHDRDVALKVLKPELAAVLGAERFVVEIKTTAALQHPHILPLFDSGETDGFLWYAMPFIDGETLRATLDRDTQLGVDEAVRITSEVADALQYAHEHGVIHRDIKPENILLANGRPMVADFGIALALSAAAGGRMTETGLSLGTPHYMSPEQATAAKDITARSDVYSLASVCYEMLSGEPPHMGNSAQQIIMKIIAETVAPVTTLRKAVPANVAAALSKALEKLPADRFESAKAFADALGNPSFRTTTHSAVHSPTNASARRTTGFAGLAIVAILFAAWGWLRPVPEPPTMRVDLTLGAAKLTTLSEVAISRDGSMLAYQGRTRDGKQAIYFRRLDGDAEFRMLAGTEAGGGPDFSPDNRWIAFTRQGAIMKVSVTGEGVSTVHETAAAFRIHWGTDDRIVYWRIGGNFIVSSSGGEPKPLEGLGGRRPFLLPDGSGVLGSTSQGVVVYDLHTDSVSLLVAGGTNPAYAESGHLLYVADNDALFAAPFDLKTHRVTGKSVRVLDRVASHNNTRGYAVSKTGTLLQNDAAGSGPSATGNRIIIHDFAGGADTLKLQRGRRWLPRFSPTGRYIAYVRETAEGDKTELFTFEVETGTETQITFRDDVGWPVWSPDGTRLAYGSTIGDSGSSIRIKAADNSGDAVEIIRSSGFKVPSAWPREDLLLFHDRNARGISSLYSVTPTAGATPQVYSDEPWYESFVTLSPDRTFAAYVSEESGQPEVWIRDYPTFQGKWKVPNGSGSAPRWSSDSRFVYYWKGGAARDTLMKVSIDRTPSVVVRAPERVAVVASTESPNWDLHPDGKHFIVAETLGWSDDVDGGDSAGERHILHLNWFTTLKATVKAGLRE